MVYARRWPDPVPAVFGYHEVFHLLVVVGVAAHFAAVTLAVVAA
jgi:hemolysin III